MEYFDLTPEQLEKLRKQEKEDLKKDWNKDSEVNQNRIERRDKLAKYLQEIDTTPLTKQETKAYDIYQNEYIEPLLESRLPFDDDNELLQFRRLLILFRNMDADDKKYVIKIGKKGANDARHSVSQVPEVLLRHRKNIKKVIPKEKSSLLWSILFPGEPYKEIYKPLTKEEYNEIKEKWWLLHLKKWGFIETLVKAADNNQKDKNLRGGALIQKKKSEESFKLHKFDLAEVLNEKFNADELISEYISKKGTIKKGKLHNIHTSYEQRYTSLSVYTLRNWLQSPDKRGELEVLRKKNTQENLTNT